MKEEYRFARRKGRAIQVMFRSDPGRWHSTHATKMKKLPLEQVNLLMGHTSYHREYDHRTGEDMLRQVQDARDTMFHTVVGKKEE